jgi:hypothetical protein
MNERILDYTDPTSLPPVTSSSHTLTKNCFNAALNVDHHHWGTRGVFDTIRENMQEKAD